LTTPGASGFYKGGLTLYTLESRIAFGESFLIRLFQRHFPQTFSSSVIQISEEELDAVLAGWKHRLDIFFAFEPKLQLGDPSWKVMLGQ